MEEANQKFMMQCRYNFHIILHYKGKLISQFIQITAARVIQHSLNWILHDISLCLLLFATKRKLILKSICFLKMGDTFIFIIKCPKGACDSTGDVTPNSSFAGLPHSAAIAGLRIAPHTTRGDKNFQKPRSVIVILSNLTWVKYSPTTISIPLKCRTLQQRRENPSS